VSIHLAALQGPTVNRTSLEDLAGLIQNMPPMPGALCRGSTDWDCDGFAGSKDTTQRDAAVESAKRRCRQCPALSACESWLYSLTKAQRPNGVVAAQLVSAIPARSAAQDGSNVVKVAS
jgi:hypothetical protein